MESNKDNFKKALLKKQLTYFLVVTLLILNQITHEVFDFPIKKDDEEREKKVISKALYLGFTLGLVMISMIVCSLRFWYSIFLSMLFGVSIAIYIA